MTIRIKALSGLLLAGALVVSAPQSSRAQDDSRYMVAPQARQAVVSGTVTDIDYDGLTISHFGREIEVDARSLLGNGLGNDLDDYYDEGMAVTVEGTMTDDDEMTATTITQGNPYNRNVPFVFDPRMAQ